MATSKTVELAGIGPVTLIKNRRSKSLRISILPHGQIKITIPSWVPYATGLTYAESKRDWIIEHRPESTLLGNNMPIGKTHRLVFIPDNIAKPLSRTKADTITVRYPVTTSVSSTEVQDVARKASVRALKAEAEDLLPNRLRGMARDYGFEVKSVSVRQLRARWGSCSHDNEITLNLFLMQLPWELIDYVIIHELVHTKHHNHGVNFWQTFETIIPQAKQQRRRLRDHKPAL